MINQWKNADYVIMPGQVTEIQMLGAHTNMVQITNRIDAAEGGKVYLDDRPRVSSANYSLKVDKGKVGNYVRPYELRTVYLTTDAQAPLPITLTEVEMSDLSVVFNASQVVDVQGGVKISDAVEIKNDEGDPINVTGSVKVETTSIRPLYVKMNRSPVISFGNDGNVYNGPVNAGQPSTPLELDLCLQAVAYGDCSAPTTITVEVSQDGTAWYPTNDKVTLAAGGKFYIPIDNLSTKYVRLVTSAAATITASLIGKG